MNLRIMKTGTNDITYERIEKILFEIQDIELEEIPKPGTTIFIEGMEMYVIRVIKSYERAKAGYPQIWFIAEV